MARNREDDQRVNSLRVRDTADLPLSTDTSDISFGDRYTNPYPCPVFVTCRVSINPDNDGSGDGENWRWTATLQSVDGDGGFGDRYQFTVAGAGGVIYDPNANGARYNSTVVFVLPKNSSVIFFKQVAPSNFSYEFNNVTVQPLKGDAADTTY